MRLPSCCGIWDTLSAVVQFKKSGRCDTFESFPIITTCSGAERIRVVYVAVLSALLVRRGEEECGTEIGHVEKDRGWLGQVMPGSKNLITH
jgi:hypothetical protein